MTASRSVRPRFFEEQFLDAEDLTALLEYSRLARARHELGAHTWGIGIGLELAELDSPAGVDVYVQPGYAWDGFGRPVVIDSPYRLPAALFSSITFDAELNDSEPFGCLVEVWIEYTEAPLGGPASGSPARSTGDQHSRVAESFRIRVGAIEDTEDSRDPIIIGGRSGAARDALKIWEGSSDNIIAETVNASWGFLRLRNRFSAENPSIWSDDLVWCEGSLRVEGDANILGGRIAFRDASNEDNQTPFTVSRIGSSQPGSPLAVRGSGDQGKSIALESADGREAWNISQKAGDTTGLNFTESRTNASRLIIKHDGNIGINTPDPSNQLHVNGNTGIRQNRLYISGGDRASNAWYSLSYNAHHNTNNSGWVFPVSARTAVSVEMDDRDGSPRFVVQTTTTTNKTTWVPRLTINGNSGVTTIAGNTGIGFGAGGAPAARLHVIDSRSAAANHIGSHVSCIENTSDTTNADVLALKVGNTKPTEGSNFITFFGGSGAVGAIEGNGSGGIKFKSSGADYAEWIQKQDTTDTFEPGDIVGIVNGRLTHSTGNADHVLAISSSPIVLGNTPQDGDTQHYEQVAIMGQVPVKVRGLVNSGDFIVASGEDDGVGVAISPDEISIEDFGRVVGTTWEGSDNTALKLVRVGIGLTMNKLFAALAMQLAPKPVITG